mgnify:CR=1 FL=1
MKRILQGLSLLLCVLCLFTACGGPTLRYENGHYTNPKTGVSYEHAPAYYVAIAYLPDEKIGDLYKGGDVTAYAIRDVDPTKMICTQNFEVLCAVGTKLPELHELKLTAAQITKTVNVSATYATLTDATALKYLAQSYAGDVFSGSEIDPSLTREKFEVKFESTNLPGVYYCLTYWRFDGDVLIYEDIDSPDTFEPTYSVDYTLHTYDNGSYYVAYNFGREILYNRTTDEACAIDQTLVNALEGKTA